MQNVSLFSTGEVTVFCDGGARGNPGPAASAFVVQDKAFVFEKGVYLGRATNNVAEYSAVLFALEWLLEQKDKLSSVSFVLDSLLVVNQLKGVFKIKNQDLFLIAGKIKKLEKELGVPVSYRHVAREFNKEADAVVNQTLDKELSFNAS